MMILFYAQFFFKRKDKVNSFKNIALALLLIIPPIYLVYKQPDMSTSIVIFVIFCTVWYVGGLGYKIIFGTLAVAVPVAVVLFVMILQPDQTLISEYQQNNIKHVYHPVKAQEKEESL